MTSVFDARAFEPALPVNDVDETAITAPVLRLVETPATPRPRRLRHRLLRRSR
jgi:hypothetical protein